MDVQAMFEASNRDAQTHEEVKVVQNRPRLLHYTQLIAHERNRKIDQEKVMDLVDSIMVIGLEQCPTVNVIPGQPGKFKLTAGHHRTEAVRYLVEVLGMKEFEYINCIVKEVDAIDEEMSLYDTNLVINELSNYDKMQAIGRKSELIQKMKDRGDNLPGKMRDLLAENLDMATTQVQKYLTVYRKASPVTKEALQNNEISFEQAYALSKMSFEEQDTLANKDNKINAQKSDKNADIETWCYKLINKEFTKGLEYGHIDERDYDALCSILYKAMERG
ncbi:ParB-like chromosome segregation protein Spo0J [Breznakia blatticola]|uniref:ParB-like chromosome segregation protein Spo0J n=1 Tax=Breznakia blatticola TaxID=1754012 RepID=A0A4R7ZQS4_9FIRM|nr:ParB/RepB/Spo0J family partition protein [Breznakia blatticola]TDW19945.1 ParB-like chromosome segregation protein Spo0J [Breznakia blatticola]